MSHSPRFSLSAVAIVSVLIGAGWSLRASGQKPVPSPPVAPPPADAKKALAPPDTGTKSDKKKIVNFAGEDWNHDDNAQTGTARNFKYYDPSEEMTVTGDSIRYNDKVKHMTADGTLILDDKKQHITGDKAEIDYGKSKKRAVITGKVVIVLKPKEEATTSVSSETPSSSTVKNEVPVAPVTPPGAKETSSTEGNSVGKERKRGVTIYCDYVDDYYKRKFIIMRGNLIFKQQITKKDGHTVERTLTADHAEYDGKTETMLLFKPVKSHDTDGQDIEFEKDVTVGTKEGAEWLKSKGKVKGIGLTDDDENGGDETAPADDTGKPTDNADKPVEKKAEEKKAEPKPPR